MVAGGSLLILILDVLEPIVYTCLTKCVTAFQLIEREPSSINLRRKAHMTYITGAHSLL